MNPDALIPGVELSVDDAVRHLDLAFDPDWARQNIGAELHQIDGIDSAVILDRNDRPVFAADEGAPVAPSHFAGMVGSGNSLLGSTAAAGAWAATALYGSPFVLHGTLGALRERLLRRRDKLGISYYTVPSRSMEAMAPLVEAMAGR